MVLTYMGYIEITSLTCLQRSPVRFLILNPVLNLTQVSFSCVLKHFLG